MGLLGPFVSTGGLCQGDTGNFDLRLGFTRIDLGKELSLLDDLAFLGCQLQESTGDPGHDIHFVLGLQGSVCFQEQFVDELIERDIAETEADFARLKAEYNQASDDAKAKLKSKMDAGKVKLQAGIDRAKARSESLKQEATAKVEALEQHIRVLTETVQKNQLDVAESRIRILGIESEIDAAAQAIQKPGLL